MRQVRFAHTHAYAAWRRAASLRRPPHRPTLKLVQPAVRAVPIGSIGERAALMHVDGRLLARPLHDRARRVLAVVVARTVSAAAAAAAAYAHASHAVE